MIGVFINHDLVRAPEPVTAETVVVRSDAKVEPAKPKTRRASSCKVPDMAGAEPAREVPVLPGMIEMVVRIATAGVMPDPLAVGVDVGGVWVPSLVAQIPVFYWGSWFPANGSRTVSRNVAGATNFTPALTASSLRERRNRKHQESYKKSDVFFHDDLQSKSSNRRSKSQGSRSRTFDRRLPNSSTLSTCSSYAVNQVELLVAALGADGESIQQVERERIFQRLIGAGSHVTLTEDLHADNRLARLAP